MRQDKLVLDKKLNEMKDINCEKIYYLEEEMSLVKTELIFIKNIQREYYQRLLKRGDDIRGKGLIWIIETMWDLEFKVYSQMLPDCMDKRSKEFLLDIANRDFELIKLKKEYQQYKISVKNSMDIEGRTLS